MAEYRNPLSKTVKKSPNLERVPIPSRVVDIAEVVSVEYGGQFAGAITYRPSFNEEISVLQNVRDIRNEKTVSNTALPLLANIRIFPIVGEYVLIFNVGGSVYYLPVNALNNPFSNKIATKADVVKLNSNVTSTFQLNKEKYYITQTSEGDIVLESRFGSSFKFGSTVKSGTNSGTLYSKSDLSKNGDPIVIIRNSPSSPYEDIQNDGASIYMCSSQKIPIDSGKNGFEGITGTWSSLNVNAEAIQGYELTSNNDYEDESGQLVDSGASSSGGGAGSGGQGGTGGAGAGGSAPAGTPTPPSAEVRDLEKLPTKYMSYAGGSPVRMEELYIVDGYPITGTIADPYLKLKKAAAEEGVLITLNSGFRANEDITMPDGSVARGQNSLYNRYLQNGSPIAARPGYSNHQSGIAVDINVSNSNTYKWLVRNAIKYGFVRGVPSERWHWEYRSNATTIYAKVPRNHYTWDGYDGGMA